MEYSTDPRWNVLHRLPLHGRAVNCLVPFFSQCIHLCLQGFHLGLPICWSWCLFHGNCLLRFQPLKTCLGIGQRGLLRLALSVQLGNALLGPDDEFPALVDLDIEGGLWQAFSAFSNPAFRHSTAIPSVSHITASACWSFTTFKRAASRLPSGLTRTVVVRGPPDTGLTRG